MKHLIYLILITTLGYSCAENQQKPAIETLKADSVLGNSPTRINPGEIYESVNCLQNPTYSYSIYLPKSYNDTLLLPVVFFYDPQGEGKLPIEKYQQIAEELQMIIACSNNSRNGLTANEISQINNYYLNDIRQRFKINNSLQFAVGFSGGARIAVQLAAQDKQIRGVAGFGAGLPNPDFMQNLNFDYVFAAGYNDFNFSELYSLNIQLAVKNITHHFIQFDGKHEWPNEKTAKASIFYLLMKADSLKTKTLIDAYNIFEFSNFKEAEQNKNITEQIQIYERMYLVFNNKDYLNKVNRLKQSSAYKTFQNNTAMSIDIEKVTKSNYNDLLANGDIDFWKNEIDKLSTLEKTSNTKELRSGYTRVKGYLGLAVYIFSNNALKNNQLQDLQKFIYIYERLEPENSEVYYLKAIFYARQNDNNLALKSLEEAVNKGFNDRNRIRKEPSFKFSELELDYLFSNKD
jgi:dienelactone hydrolase